MANALVRWRLVATGIVQLVGYRARVAAEAQKRKLVGTVENDEADERRVFIEVQGAESEIEDFRRKIEIPEDRSRPTSVVREGEALPVDETLTEFRVKRGDVHLETLERMEFAGEALSALTSVTKDFAARTEQGLSSLSGEMKQGFSSLSGEMKQGFSSLSGEMKQGFSSLSGEMKQGFSSLGDQTKQGFDLLGDKIDEGNRATSALHHDMVRRFDQMSTTYGMISKRLGLIERDLRAQTKATIKQTDSLLRLAKSMERVVRAIPGNAAPSPKSFRHRQRSRPLRSASPMNPKAPVRSVKPKPKH